MNASIQLPPVEVAGDAVLATFQARRSTRAISDRPLPLELLSRLLWAACGVNRASGPFGQPGRTAASASNSQEIELYVALAQGVYRYLAVEHALEAVLGSDLRAGALTPGQRGVPSRAPVQLIYVVDLARLTQTSGFEEPRLQDPEYQKAYYYVDTGLIAGNVYLFAAASGLAAWFHNCERTGLGLRLGLNTHQQVLFAQSVGYPDTA